VLAVSDTRSPTEKEVEEIKMLHHLPVREDTLRRIQECTHADLVLKALANVIKQGWPESKPHLPQNSKTTSHSKKSSLCRMELSLKCL